MSILYNQYYVNRNTKLASIYEVPAIPEPIFEEFGEYIEDNFNLS